MPSSLQGLLRQLSWSDFRVVQGNPPGPGQHAAGAFTSASIRPYQYAFRPPHGAHTPLSLVDNLTISIVFDAGQSWVKSWVSSSAGSFASDLLNHEQGHYTITALVGRDFFVDMMLLKSRSFPNRTQANQAVSAIQSASLSKLAAIQALYDNEVHPEQDSGQSRGPIQQLWDGYFQAAFIRPRASGTTAPDGTAHKERLVDVLRAAGKTV
jgi:hypothetical protein